MTADHAPESQSESRGGIGTRQLLVRNRVADYARWRACFDEDLGPAADYGLKLDALWQDAADPNNVFFLFAVRSIDEAEAFMARPESQEMGTRAGVLDGEFSFLVPAAT
ncbi:MAG: hypothetical protein AAF552_17730 [Pseudomonadota bacterium]